MSITVFEMTSARPSAWTAARQGACILMAVGTLWLSITPAAAQPAPPPSEASRSQAQRPGAGPGMVVSPPDSGDREMAQPVPRRVDPGLIEKPPADRHPGPGAKSDSDASARSRQDDCKGSAADCKQNSAR